jgi:hypothetical protein
VWREALAKYEPDWEEVVAGQSAPKPVNPPPAKPVNTPPAKPVNPPPAKPVNPPPAKDVPKKAAVKRKPVVFDLEGGNGVSVVSSTVDEQPAKRKPIVFDLTNNDDYDDDDLIIMVPI